MCSYCAANGLLQSEDVRELSLHLAGWMIHLGGKAATPESGYQLAEAALTDGAGLAVFLKMVDAQGGDVSVVEDLNSFHRPGATLVLEAWTSGFVVEMDTMMLGWAVQRTGAGREKAGEPVDPHAGIVFHARRGARVEKGQPFATIYATSEMKLAEPAALLRMAVKIAENAPAPVDLIDRLFTKESATAFLSATARD